MKLRITMVGEKSLVKSTSGLFSYIRLQKAGAGEKAPWLGAHNTVLTED